LFLKGERKAKKMGIAKKWAIVSIFLIPFVKSLVQGKRLGNGVEIRIVLLNIL
jgi:hypothetical protein